MAADRDDVPAGRDDVFELTVPASADRLSVARLFAAAMIRHEGAEEDDVEDLRLAVSEACTIALQAARSPLALVVTLRPAENGIALDVRTTAEDDRARAPEAISTAADRGPERGRDREVTPPPELHAVPEPAEGWGTDLLEAIVSDLEFTSQADGQIGVSFAFPMARRERPASGISADPGGAHEDQLDPS